MKERESNYDIIRIISILAVITVHVTSLYTSAIVDPSLFGEVKLGHMGAIAICDAFDKIGVPCFVMLSGAFLLDQEANAQYGLFYRKTFHKIGRPAMIACVFYFCVNLMKSYLNAPTGYGWLLQPVIQLLKGMPYYHLWYLFMMLWVWALVPVLIKIKADIGEKRFAVLAIIFLALSSASSVTSEHVLYWDLGESLYFSSYFVMGYVIRKHTSQRKSMVKAVLWIGIAIGCCCAGAYLRYWQLMAGDIVPQSRWIQLSNLHPLVIGQSVSLFIGFSYLRIRWNVYPLAGKVFYIFLVHAFVWDVMKIGVMRYAGLMENSMVSIVCCVILVFIISWILVESILFFTKRWRIKQNV